jgi:hypothetical protein
MARAGIPLSLVGAAIGREVQRRGFHVLRELCGHGTGRRIHEPPTVPNYHEARLRTRLTDGLVIAMEPLVSAGTSWTRAGDDGWTIRSGDGSLCIATRGGVPRSTASGWLRPPRRRVVGSANSCASEVAAGVPPTALRGDARGHGRW